MNAALTRKLLVPFVLCAAGMPSAFASLSYGTFSTSGTVDISFNTIKFVASSHSNAPTFTATNEMGFPILIGGTIKPITNAMNPVGVVHPIPDFMTFIGAPTDSFTLTEILPGDFGPGTAMCTIPPAAGQNCTPAGTPYDLSNLSAKKSVASFTVIGNEVDSVTGMTAPFSGVFSTTFNTPYQNIFNLVASGKTVVATYSGAFEVVPEPGFMVPLAGGIVGLLGAALARRRANKNVV